MLGFRISLWEVKHFGIQNTVLLVSQFRGIVEGISNEERQPVEIRRSSSNHSTLLFRIEFVCGGRHKGGYHWMALGSRIGHRSCSEVDESSRAEREWEGQWMSPNIKGHYLNRLPFETQQSVGVT